jgi:hypothetical protein
MSSVVNHIAATFITMPVGVAMTAAFVAAAPMIQNQVQPGIGGSV